MLTAYNGRQYRCVVSDGNGNSVTSNAITLTVGTAQSELKITEQPVDITAPYGEEITLHIAAEGDNLSYQWQWKSSTGTSWTNATAAGAKTADWTITMLTAYNGRQYQCVVNDANGNSVVSSVITLTLATDVVDGDFVFAKLEDGSGYSLKKYNGSDAYVVVPTTINGLPVIEIGEEAFMANLSIETVVLPNSITIIRARAFKNCSNLKEMKNH